MNRRLALWLMVGCILIAAALRIPSLIENPPGLHFDEAANGILAGDIGLRGQRPLFITSYTGKETLFFYLAGALMRLLGESVFALRLSAAFIGLLTIAATYRLGYELLRDRCMAVIATALLAVSFWHILFSRLGFRAISQPLLQALTVAALFYGLRRNSRTWIIAGGITLGLTAYTYLAARIFPLVLALSLIPLIAHRAQRRLHLRQLALYFSVGLLVALPLLVFFIREPDAFWVRIDQVLPEDHSLVDYLDSYGKTLGAFFILGDPYWRFNIPDKPIFNWFWGGLAVIGWLVSLFRMGKHANPRIRSAYLLLVLMPLFMILPSALAIDEIVPSNLRAIGLLPFIYLLPAIGMFTLLLAFQRPANEIYQRLLAIVKIRRLPEQLPDHWATKPPMLTAVVLLILIIGGINGGWSYFQQWSTRTDLFYDSDADLAAAAAYLDEQELSDSTIFLSAEHYRHPTIAFLSDRYDEVKWLPESQALVIPDQLPASYIFPANSPLPDWAAPYLPASTRDVGPLGPDDQPAYHVYHLTGQSPNINLANEVNVNFDNLITLRGYEVGRGTAGESLIIDLHWRIEEVPDDSYIQFVHFEDAWGNRWSQAEPFAYATEQWTAGDQIVQRIEMPIPEGTPPGSYFARLGMFNPESFEQLSVLDSAGRYAGNAWTIENIFVDIGRPLRNPPLPAFTTNQQAGPNLKLVGYERSSESVDVGADLPLALWWESTGPLNPMTIRFELISPDNRGRILINTDPVHGTYPFNDWKEPQFIIDHHDVMIPQDTQPGAYRLGLRLLDGADETLLTSDLGPVNVQESQRQFIAPKTQFPQAATFGSEITLLGNDLETDSPGEYDLTLVWQALEQPANDYTVFIHILDLDGTCCVWQDDSWPQRGNSPTSDWLPGEVVVDNYAITLPEEIVAGSYALEIGLYLAENGQRLLVEVPRLPPKDALFLRPLVIE